MLHDTTFWTFNMKITTLTFFMQRRSLQIASSPIIVISIYKETSMNRFSDIAPVNDILLRILALLKPLNLGDCKLQIKRFQVFSHEFWKSNPDHSHPFFELVAVLRGEVSYQVENREVRLKPHMHKAMLAVPGIQHYRGRILDDDIVVILQFSLIPLNTSGTVRIKKLQDALAERKYELEDVSLNSLVEILNLCQDHQPFLEMRLVNRLEYFFLSLFSGSFGDIFAIEESSHKNGFRIHQGISRIERIKQAIETTLDSQLALDEYAVRIGLSPRQIERIVKKHFNVSFGQYVRARRLEAAKNLLRSPFSSIKGVANSLGFDDVSYFCRIFRHAVGVTPGKYAINAQLSPNGKSAKKTRKRIPYEGTILSQ